MHKTHGDSNVLRMRLEQGKKSPNKKGDERIWKRVKRVISRQNRWEY